MLSDHQPLSQALLLQGEPGSSRQTCQLSYISEFTNSIIYVKGEDNQVDDALSCDVLDQLNSIVTTISLDKFATAQKSCPDVKS